MPTIREVRYKGCFLSGLGTEGNIFNLCLLFDGNSELFCDLFLRPGGFGTVNFGGISRTAGSAAAPAARNGRLGTAQAFHNFVPPVFLGISEILGTGAGFI